MVKKSDKKDSNAKRNHSKDHNLLRENIASVPSNKINYIYLNTLHLKKATSSLSEIIFRILWWYKAYTIS